MSTYPSQYFNPPIPGFNNPPIMPQDFKPSRFVISSLTFTQFAITVTTSENHNFVVGQLVRLIIPPAYGSFQLNETSGYVTSIPSSNQVILSYGGIYIDPFISSPTFGPTPPEILAIGDVNTGLISSTGRSLPTTTIPGSFVNISPQPQ